MEKSQCRLCLLSIGNEKVMNLFGMKIKYNIIAVINKLLDIEILESDYFSKFICNICFDIIDHFNNYSLKIKYNNRSLIEQYSKINEKNDMIIHDFDAKLDESADKVLQNDARYTINDDNDDYFRNNDNGDNCENNDSNLKNINIDDKYANTDFCVQINDENNRNGLKKRISCQTLKHTEIDGDITSNEDNSDNENNMNRKLGNNKRTTGCTQNINPQVILEEKEDNTIERTNIKNERKIPYSETANDVQIKKFYKYECDLCSNHDEITTFRLFKHHYRDHHGIAAYIRCCGKRFTKPYQLVEHIEEHLAPESLICPTCNKKLRTKRTLLYHMDKHVPIKERPLKCKNCDMRFTRKHHLIQHERIHIEEDKKTVCDLCGKRFPAHWFLKTHLETTHSSVKRFFCEICGKAFKSNVQLRNHKYSHNSKDEPYKQCEMCGASCRSPRQYYSHMKERHDETTPKKFPCEKCGHISPTKKALYAHTINKHGPKILNCSFCNKSFSSTNLLKSHMVKHTGPGEPLKCPYCPKTFSFRSGLYSHRKRVHSDMIIRVAESDEKNCNPNKAFKK